MCVCVCTPGSKKPSMQIVLWKPPGDFVRNIISTNTATGIESSDQQCDDDDEDDVMADVTDTSRSVTQQQIQHVTSLRTVSAAVDNDMDL